MPNLPAIITVKEVISNRRTITGLTYEGCPLFFLDWHPARDGTHYAVIVKANRSVERWLNPDTWLELSL
jgi:hypothetical protein